jgi:hypothetical protein
MTGVAWMLSRALSEEPRRCCEESDRWRNAQTQNARYRTGSEVHYEAVPDLGRLIHRLNCRHCEFLRWLWQLTMTGRPSRHGEPAECLES